jgi:hypothetical protein
MGFGVAIEFSKSLERASITASANYRYGPASGATVFYVDVVPIDHVISRCEQENPRLWSTAQADGSLSVWTCNDNAGRPVVLYSGRIGSDCSQGSCVFSPPHHALAHNRVPGSPLDKSFLVRFSAVDDHVVLLTGASMGGAAMRV